MGRQAVSNAALLLQLLLMILGGSMEPRVGSLAFVDFEQIPNRCKPIKLQRMLQAHCRDHKLEEVPQNLQSDIEVLDLRENRIRNLDYNRLSRYSDLRFLYMADNFVQSVPADAFRATPELEVLDLSKNGLNALPRDLLRMPKLRNVYLGENHLDDSQFEPGQAAAGEERPLFLLQLAQNRLTRLPVRGVLPRLSSLNLSDNAIERVSVHDIAGMCSLRELDLLRNPIAFNQSGCDCYDLRDWASTYGVKLNLTQECPAGQSERCGSLRGQEERLNATRQLRAECLRERELADARAARSGWLWIAMLVGAFVGCALLALRCVQQRSEQRRRELDKEQQALGEHAALPCARPDEVLCCDERRPPSPGPDAPAKEHLLLDKGLPG